MYMYIGKLQYFSIPTTGKKTANVGISKDWNHITEQIKKNEKKKQRIICVFFIRVVQQHKFF